MIERAKAGTYSQFEVQRGLGVTQMLRHFDETPGGWQVRSDVRAMVRFAQANLLSSQHPGRIPFDLVLCRNVLLYFERQVRHAAFERLAGAVMPDGFLMLGAGETVVGQTDRFLPSSRRASFFEPAIGPASATFRKIA